MISHLDRFFIKGANEYWFFMKDFKAVGKGPSLLEAQYNFMQQVGYVTKDECVKHDPALCSAIFCSEPIQERRPIYPQDKSLKQTDRGFEYRIAGWGASGQGQSIQEAKDSFKKKYPCATIFVDEDTDVQVQTTSAPMKFDQGKLDWSLLPEEPLEPVIRVLMFGCKKYAPDNWQKVPRRKLYNSLRRHIFKYFIKREQIDADSGESHLACAICNLLFLLWAELKGEKVWESKNDHKDSIPCTASN